MDGTFFYVVVSFWHPLATQPIPEIFNFFFIYNRLKYTLCIYGFWYVYDF